MHPHDSSDAVPPHTQGSRTAGSTIAQLVGQIYAAAPATDRCRILEQLMRPLGALSLVAVANGVFAKLWFRSGWHDLHITVDDVTAVQAVDVISLTDYVQQASIEAVDGLSQILTTSPALAGSAAAIVLVTVLVRRAQTRLNSKSDP